ncbi:MAG: M15 family metallopeptidase [Myxococcota bacterium]
MDKPVLVDVRRLDARFLFDIKYATQDNFTGKQLYPIAKCLLLPEVGQMVVKAQAYLDTHHMGYVLMFKDCYRPHHIQRLMWDVVKGTPQQSYVANPHSQTGSVHNYGAAVDLTLATLHGQEVDMGTPYDTFDALAQPRYEDKFLNEGKLSAKQVEHRRILRSAMVKGGGFKMIRNEWWHFDAWQGDTLRRRYKILDVPLEDF